MEACHRAFEAYQDDTQLGEMRRAAMARSFGWSAAAAEYEALYRRLIGLPPVGVGPRTQAVRKTPPVTEALEPAA